jgi:hypothetical protein
MLRCDHRFDDSGKVVDIWKGLNAEKDVVKWTIFIVRRVFGCADNYDKKNQ